jgi:hypothetical protein
MADLNVEALINVKKPKYPILEQILPKLPSQIKLVRFFVDLDSTVVSSVFDPRWYGDNFKEDTNDGTNHRLLASILNTIGYLRHYATSRMEVASDFHCFWGTEVAKRETQIFPDYRKEFYEKRGFTGDVANIVKDWSDMNLREFSNVAEYIPGVFAYPSGDLNPDLIPEILVEKFIFCEEGLQRNEILDIIVCGGSAFPMLQYASKPYTRVLTLAGDNSFVLNKDNAIEYLQQKSKVKVKETSFNAKLMPIIMALTGFKKYGVNGKKGVGIGKALGIIEKLIASEVISKESVNAINFFKECHESEPENVMAITAAYNTLSITDGAISSEMYQDANLSSKLIEKRDWKGLQSFLEQNFSSDDFVVNIDFLLE